MYIIGINAFVYSTQFHKIYFIHIGHAFPCFLHIWTLGSCVLENSLISIVMTNIHKCV